MTLRSALEDVRQTTLAAVSGLLGKLAYLASLRGQEGHYEHWGMKTVYGEESSERALRTAHTEVVNRILRAPLASLADDLQESSAKSGIPSPTFLQRMRDRFEQLLPGDRKDSPVAAHLSSVLAALSSLEKNRGRATRSVS